MVPAVTVRARVFTASLQRDIRVRYGKGAAPSPTVITVDALSRTPMRRVAAACLVGSAIEFYDFLIYGTAAALVFPTVFFPHLSPALATIASLGTGTCAVSPSRFASCSFEGFSRAAGVGAWQSRQL